RPALRPAFRTAFGPAVGTAFGTLDSAFTGALLQWTRFALRTTLAFRRGTTVTPSLAARAARNAMWITSALFAQGGGQAGGNACRFRPFVFHDRHGGFIHGRFAIRRRLGALGIRFSFVFALGYLVCEPFAFRYFSSAGRFGLAFLGALLLSTG